MKAIVSGGTRGIGKAISLALKEIGCQVIALYNSNKEAAEAFAAENGIRIKQLNVGNFTDCLEFSQQETEVDIVINNAGITRDVMFHKMDVEQWQEVINVNLNSCFNLTRGFLPGMRERKKGKIINISSVNGQKGQKGQTNYAAAKAGIIGFTRALAQEVGAFGVTVNAIAPGYIETDMVKAVPEAIMQKILAEIPLGRLGKPEEVAQAVIFLVQNDFCNGSVISLNGGQYFA